MKIKTCKDMVLKFCHSHNKNIAFVRGIFFILVLILIVFFLLWTYTGQWFAQPLVVIESGSMEHTPPMYSTDPPFGRLATIDAGDLLLSKKVMTRKDITVHGGNFGGAQAENGWKSYGDYGDAIIFFPDGHMDEISVVHRAMCWVDVKDLGSERRYTIQEFGIYNQSSLGPIPELGLDYTVTPNWTHSGFLTKGDNNKIFDNLANQGIYQSTQPIKVEWIEGKARGEIPWFGTINLLLADIVSGTNKVNNVHEDCLICLIVVIISIASIILLIDFIGNQNQKEPGEKEP